MDQRIVHILNSDIDSIMMGISECQAIQLKNKNKVLEGCNNKTSKFFAILRTIQKKQVFYYYTKNDKNFTLFSNYFNNIAKIEDIMYIYDIICDFNSDSCLILVNNNHLQIIKNKRFLFSTKNFNNITYDTIQNVIINNLEATVINQNLQKEMYASSYEFLCGLLQLSPYSCIKEVLIDEQNFKTFEFYA